MRYKAKPNEVEAIQYTGTNDPECQEFAGSDNFDPPGEYGGAEVWNERDRRWESVRNWWWIVKDVEAGILRVLSGDSFIDEYEPV